MAKLHELLAAEKTPTGAWNALYEDTLKKFKNTDHFFKGFTKSLSMIVDNPENKAIEDAAREEKPVTTTVVETLDYALDIWAKAEDLQYQKNSTNRKATGDLVFRGQTILTGLPVDELLGLEARLLRLRQLFEAIPTVDATKNWERNSQLGEYIWVTTNPVDTTKTEKRTVAVEMSPATKEHKAQVQAVSKDEVVGKYTAIHRSGEATAIQKAGALKVIDDLIVSAKQARMRANETEAVEDKIAATITTLLLAPLKQV